MKTGSDFNKSQITSIAAAAVEQIVQRLLSESATVLTESVKTILEENDSPDLKETYARPRHQFLIEVKLGVYEAVLFNHLGRMHGPTGGDLFAEFGPEGWSIDDVAIACKRLRRLGLLAYETEASTGKVRIYLTDIGQQVRENGPE